MELLKEKEKERKKEKKKEKCKIYRRLPEAKSLSVSSCYHKEVVSRSSRYGTAD